MAGAWWPPLRAGELVAYLTDEEHNKLVQALIPVTAEPGDVIFYKGAPSKSLVIVEEGEVEAFEEASGRLLVLGSAGAGAVMGEVGFMDGLPRSNHVRAKTSCRLGKLTRDGLLNLASEDPLVFAKIVISMAELLAGRYRSVVAELEPVRALVASVREAGKDRPVAILDLDAGEQSQAMEVLKAVALQAKDLAEL